VATLQAPRHGARAAGGGQSPAASVRRRPQHRTHSPRRAPAALAIARPIRPPPRTQHRIQGRRLSAKDRLAEDLIVRKAVMDSKLFSSASSGLMAGARQQSPALGSFPQQAQRPGERNGFGDGHESAGRRDRAWKPTLQLVRPSKIFTAASPTSATAQQATSIRWFAGVARAPCRC